MARTHVEGVDLATRAAMMHSKRVLIRDDDAGSPDTILRLMTLCRRTCQHGVRRHDSKFLELHPQEGRRTGSGQPADGRVSSRHTARRLPLPDGVRRAHNMAHAQASIVRIARPPRISSTSTPGSTVENQRAKRTSTSTAAAGSRGRVTVTLGHRRSRCNLCR